MTDGKIHNIFSMPSYCSEMLKLAWTIQGRIQDFPESGTPTHQVWWVGGGNICMKLKKNWTPSGARVTGIPDRC